jgi:hypothetical protein
MRKFVLGLLGATALTVASAANATVTIDATSFTAQATSDGDLTFSTGYLDNGAGSPFNEFITWTETWDGLYSFDLQSIGVTGAAATDVDFTSVWLSGTGIVGSILINPAADSTDLFEHYALTDLALDAGTYTLRMTGTRGTTSTFTGNISFAAVPEPGTWAMMLLGFGAVGFAMRRRRTPALAQLA